ncbi:hypothetical protein [Nocardia alni]|uniref:hypothetical protein n=1 Tax=Nocardia alni TaxID=2815723 RepID=UPI001C2402B3|nr:hypothetical protein [Nocardia alni]
MPSAATGVIVMTFGDSTASRSITGAAAVSNAIGNSSTGAARSSSSCIRCASGAARKLPRSNRTRTPDDDHDTM